MKELLSDQDETGTLNTRLTDGEREELVHSFWPHDPPLSIPFGYIEYFKRYEKICNSLYRFDGVSPENMVTNTHKHIFQIVDAIYEILRSSAPCNRPEARRLLQTEKYFGAQPTGKLNCSINLALRLWLLINTQERGFGKGIFATWDDHSTLRDFIEKRFPGPRGTTKLPGATQIGTDKERSTVFESNFTAANLERIAGIKIEWTYNLLEHLRFNKNKRKLWIFPLKQYLYNQQDVKPEVIPTCITKELIQSINLLFPEDDIPTQKFVSKPSSLGFSATLTQHLPFTTKRTPQPFLSEEPVLDPGRVYLCEFYHFRDRLAEIAYEFSSPPPTVRQVWTDRRNALQWWTFWFAVAIFAFTIVFGAVTVLLAVLQTKYAYEMLVLAREAAGSAGVSSLVDCECVARM